jgi:hypothetical protein
MGASAWPISITEPDMPPAIIWALGVFGAMVAARWLAREAQRINSRLHPEDAVATEAEVRTLEQDPVTGIYRPK